MVKIKDEDLNIKKIAQSGQCFRMNKEDNHWVNIAFGKELLIYPESDKDEDGEMEYTLNCSKSDFNKLWSPYFDLQSNYAQYRKQIPASDTFLSNAADFGKGIRILRQDPWEMLITFIISQRKSIPAIKSSVESLCRIYGMPIGESKTGIHYAFPDVSALANAKEKDLQGCGLGYRVPYIIAASKAVYEGKIDLKKIDGLSDEDLLSKLMEIHGVGIKVANCVSLFAYHRIDAFPIDVWIARVLEEKYDNRFPFDLYAGFGGVIQQYMFYYARNNKQK